jgi:hypothetical protein
VAVAQAQPERAARLFRAAERLPEMVAFPVAHAGCAERDRSVAAVRTALSEAGASQCDAGPIPGFAAAWAEGQALSLEEAARYALEEVVDG